jgi:hypothetical protein
MKEAFLVTTILSLLVLGLVIALRSGGFDLSTSRGVRVLVGNVSLLVLRLIGYVAGLFVLHKAIGSPSMSLW